MAIKSFFEQPSAAQIASYSTVKEASDNLVEAVLGLKAEEALIIARKLIPDRHQNPRKFMKHGREVKLRRLSSLEEAVNYGQPLQQRREAFNSISSQPYCGYSFKPVAGTDKRTRRVSLVECLEGAKIFCYAHPRAPYYTFSGSSLIEVRPYDRARRVEIEGAEVILKVPSRTKKMPKYQFRLSSVPVADSREKMAIASRMLTDHNCGSKRFNIRYVFFDEKEDSRAFNFCAHEIAGYLAVMKHYLKEDMNMVPITANPFAIPTQATVDFYSKLCRNCLIKESEDEKPRQLNTAEKEIMLWGLVRKQEHDYAFYPKGKKVKDYKW